MKIQVILTDIEGTTSSIRFVHDVLFPYAAQELPAFVRANATDPDIAALLDATRKESGETDAPLERVIAILLGWIAADRKATPLKALQGHIWRRGYESGDFTGHIYQDAIASLRRWSMAGIRLYVYSSGSVAAQRLLFRHSDGGDLTPLFEGFFDTNVGQKKDFASYRRIADLIDIPPGDVLFLSDVVAELDAAKAAGMQTWQLVRDSGVPVGPHRTASSFNEVIIDTHK
jgi:enolase-phosphatase E1